jgi:hypothetical protein
MIQIPNGFRKTVKNSHYDFPPSLHPKPCDGADRCVEAETPKTKIRHAFEEWEESGCKEEEDLIQNMPTKNGKSLDVRQKRMLLLGGT